MKNSQERLFKLAAKLQYKYAQGQSLQEIIGNAASYGQDIMNFPAQLKRDKANLIISVTVTSGLMGGKTVTVGEPRVDPPQFAANYSRLSEQIKKYLDKYINDFPQVPTGTTVLQYSGEEASPEIAAR